MLFLSGFKKALGSGSMVLHYPSAFVVQNTKIVLGLSLPLLCRLARPFYGRRIVLL